MARYVIEDVAKKRKVPPRILSTAEIVAVERRLKARTRHPRSKVISDQEIMKIEQRMWRQQFVRDAEGI